MTDLAIVFVYGTLKVGGFFAEQFDEYRRKYFKATVYGALYSVNGQFPAALLGDEGVIHGEVHVYTNGIAVLEAMNNIEGCEVPEEEGHPANMFNRVTTIAEFDNDNAEVPVFMYTWNQEIDSLERINSGIWEL